MEHYRKSSHTVYDIKYHLVWITKYRKPVLQNDVEIIKGHVSKNHIHLFVSVPPHVSVSQLVQYLKGKSSRKMMMEFKTLSRTFWGRHIWAQGYFVATSGNVTDEVIMKYIEQQELETPDTEFKIDSDTE